MLGVLLLIKALSLPLSPRRRRHRSFSAASAPLSVQMNAAVVRMRAVSLPGSESYESASPQLSHQVKQDDKRREGPDAGRSDTAAARASSTV